MGMRIPLHYPEECVSLWPGRAATNNARRQIFQTGAIASQTVNIDIQDLENSQSSAFVYTLHDATMKDAGRAGRMVYVLASTYLFRNTFPVRHRGHIIHHVS